MTTLQELGERYIARQVLPQFCEAVGDDCAFVPIGDLDLALTTDPAPEPASKVIGGDADLYWVGRLLVTINASDLAAAGAAPLAFLSAVECASTSELNQFERLLEGIRDGCAAEGLQYVGGNLKEASRLAATGTAVGIVKHGRGLRRIGARAGDLLFSVGQGGIFWRDALRIRRGAVIDKTSSPVFAPQSQIKNMQLLQPSIRIHASMDNSDGLLPTLAQLAEANNLAITLDLDSLKVPDMGDLQIEPYRLWLGWGDWNVVIVVPPESKSLLIEISSRHNIPITGIGSFHDSAASLWVERNGLRVIAPRLESERFAKDSWFSAGIDGYISLLINASLP